MMSMSMLRVRGMNFLDTYLKDKWIIRSSPFKEKVVPHFEELIKDSNNFETEVARKLYLKKRAISNKINFIFKYNLSENYIKILDFLRKISDVINLNYSKKFLKKINRNIFKKLMLIAVGLDPENDKISFWLEFTREPKLLFYAANMYGYGGKMIELIPDTYSFGVGFDYFLNGKTNLTVYHSFRGPDYENPAIKTKLLKHVPPKILQLMQKSPLSFLSFRKPHFKKFLQMFSNDVRNILDNLHVKEEFVRRNVKFEGLNPYIVGFFIDEAVNNQISVLNLYYLIS